MIEKMTSTERIQSTRWINNRRSQRVILSFPVVVRAQPEGEDCSTEQSCTLVVNAHGALIAMALKVKLGQRLMLENVGSGQEQSCCVVHVGERKSDKAEVGVEFVAPAPRFWNIDFPPVDWQPLRD
jgi:hypothetical protein